MQFMNKSLSRTFMRRKQLRSKYLKKRSETNRLAYAKQRNFCVSLLRKTKKDYYANENEEDIADTKKRFGKQLNHYSQTKFQRQRKKLL